MRLTGTSSAGPQLAEARGLDTPTAHATAAMPKVIPGCLQELGARLRDTILIQSTRSVSVFTGNQSFKLLPGWRH
jgi:hypothetical protein